MMFGFRFPRFFTRTMVPAGLLVWSVSSLPLQVAAETPRPYGLDSQPASKAYLLMPWLGGGALPPRLSQTGAFKDTPRMVVADGLIPYDLILPFWSDGAVKSRWISVPRGKIQFSPTGEWVFPRGTVFVKTFELATDETHPEVRRRLETRLLVCDPDGRCLRRHLQMARRQQRRRPAGHESERGDSIKTATGSGRRHGIIPAARIA